MHINKQELLIYYENKEIHAKNIVSGSVLRSEHRIDTLNVKPVGKEHLNVFIPEPLIEKMGIFWDSVKNIPEVIYKKSCS